MNQTIVGPTGVRIMQPLQSSFVLPTLNRTRWFVAGPVKTGKTTLIANNPKAFVVDIEDKLCYIAPSPDGPRRCDYCVPANYKELEQVLEWLVRDKAKLPYEMIGFDTVDELLHGTTIPGMTEALFAEKPGLRDKIEDITEHKSSDRGSGGWAIVNNRMIRYLRDIYRVGYGWWVTGHIKEEEQKRNIGGKVETITVRRPSISPGIRAGLHRSAIFLGTSGWKTGAVIHKEFLVDGTWMKEGPEVEAIRQKGDKLLEKQMETVMSTPVLRITEKVGDSEVSVGANVSFPGEVLLTLPNPWDCVVAGYNPAGGSR